MNSASAFRATPDPVYETITTISNAASPQLELPASISRVGEIQLDEEVKNMTYVGVCTPHESNITSVKNLAYEPSGFQ